MGCCEKKNKCTKSKIFIDILKRLVSLEAIIFNSKSEKRRVQLQTGQKKL
jgi:hypothetical protein